MLCPESATTENMTEHEVVMYDGQGQGPVHIYPPEDNGKKVARAISKDQELLNAGDDPFPIYTAQRFVGVDIPKPKKTTTGIIVSMAVGQYLVSSDYEKKDGQPLDVYGPNSGPRGTIRENGNIRGTKGLVHYGQFRV